MGLQPNSSHQLETALWMLSESCEIVVLCSKHPHRSVWYLCYSIFFRSPRLKALMLLNTGWLVSLKRPTIWGLWNPFSFRCVAESSVPLLFVSRAEVCPMSSRESLRVILDVPGISDTLFWIYCPCPFDGLRHWHEHDSIFKVFKFHVSALQVFMDLLEDLQWRKSWENIQLELDRFSINSKQFSVQTGLSKFFYLIFPSSICFWIIWRFLQA